MKQTRIIMGMPITIEIVDQPSTPLVIDKVFEYFKYVDQKFSPSNFDAEISEINSDSFNLNNHSLDMNIIMHLTDMTKTEINNFFDIYHQGILGPLSLIKGWAVLNASKILKNMKVNNFYIEAGGDIQVCGKNSAGNNWRVGIRNPFNIREIIKIVGISNCGIATSGTYFHGSHIYHPNLFGSAPKDLVSLTVIGPNIYEADRFATAAFAMGKKGIDFINRQPGFEGYLIDSRGLAIYTNGFDQYSASDD